MCLLLSAVASQQGREAQSRDALCLADLLRHIVRYSRCIRGSTARALGSTASRRGPRIWVPSPPLGLVAWQHPGAGNRAGVGGQQGLGVHPGCCSNALGAGVPAVSCGCPSSHRVRGESTGARAGSLGVVPAGRGGGSSWLSCKAGTNPSCVVGGRRP